MICARWACDVNGTGAITTTDALSVLRGAIGVPTDDFCVEERVSTGTGTHVGGSGEGTAVTLQGVARITSVLFYLEEAATSVGSLQMSFDYTNATGDFVGDAELVDCTNLSSDSHMAFIERPDRSLGMDWISVAGERGPATLAECRFAITGHLRRDHFTYNGEVATDTENHPISGVVVTAYPN